jgi:hypothetical protein
MGLASKRQVIEGPDGKDIVVNCFRCRRCLHIFNDMEWRIDCEAPPLETDTMRSRRERDFASQRVNQAVEDIKLIALERGATADEARQTGTAYMFYMTGKVAQLKPEWLELLRKFTDAKLDVEEIKGAAQ